MIIRTSKCILGLIGSLIFVMRCSAHQIDIHFDNQSSIYTSPVIYLTGVDGLHPKVAMKEGIPTIGGVSENEEDLTKFTSVSFKMTPEIAFAELKIIPNSNNENPFCNDLNVSLDENKILLPSTFSSKLTTSTSCHFKIVSLDSTKNEVAENKITFNFNYTLLGWLSDFGKGTKAQDTAKIMNDMCIDPNSIEIKLIDKNLEDISPLMGFIKTEEFSLMGNKIKEIPEAIGNLINLKYLFLHNNQIEEIPEAIGNLIGLKYLSFQNNLITIIPNSIGRLSNLKILDLADNKIEEIPEVIGNLTHLESLYIRFNKIKVIPETVRSLAHLKDLNLQYNQITKIPDIFGGLASLEGLNLSNNQITEIPDSIGELAHLRDLFLQYNQITEIPDSIGSLKNLAVLNLSNNKLTIIPDFFGRLVQLDSLYFSNNQIYIIPDSIGLLVRLQELYLDNNQIEAIPDVIHNFTNIICINLENNQIQWINSAIYNWLLDKKAVLSNNPGFNNDFVN